MLYTPQPTSGPSHPVLDGCDPQADSSVQADDCGEGQAALDPDATPAADSSAPPQDCTEEDCYEVQRPSPEFREELDRREAKRVGESNRFVAFATADIRRQQARWPARRQRQAAACVHRRSRSRESRPSTPRRRGSRRWGAGAQAGPDEGESEPDGVGPKPRWPGSRSGAAFT